MNTRKLLQDTSVKLFDLEKESEKKLMNLQTAYEKLEKEKQAIEVGIESMKDCGLNFINITNLLNLNNH